VQIGNTWRQLPIYFVQNERPHDVAIEAGYAEGRYVLAERPEHRGSRALHGGAADDRADGNYVRPPPLKNVADPGQPEDRTDADKGIARRDNEPLGLFKGVEHSWSWLRRLQAGKAHCHYLVLLAALDEVLLKGERAGGRDNLGANTVVRHG